MAMIQNPVLPGFHPDPSILRVGEDYYIAVSTFEYYPGVEIHHSRDLVHWRLLTRPLRRRSQLDMAGEHSSCGIWAPCLSHDGERFHLIYTDVKQWAGRPWDCYNYLVTAETIDGEWSERVYLNASGFDPSLFHDDDGRKWLVNMIQDTRPGRNRFGGIVLQAYDPAARRLVGPVRHIFHGTELGCTEAPHLYKRNGWYYLMTAEGGTGYGHAVTMARARALEGPYEVDPKSPMLTSREKERLALQKSGHASLCDTPAGDWYLAHLCGRPVKETGRCVLGRETAIQRVAWTEDGWLRLANRPGQADGDEYNDPALEAPAPDLPPHPWPAEPARDDFDAPTLAPCWQTLREPHDPSWLSLTERPGWLRLRGRLSPQSCYDQSLVARRIEGFHTLAETILAFAPVNHLDTAGLMVRYDERKWYYLAISRDEALGRCLRLLTCLGEAKHEEPLPAPIDLPEEGPIRLRATVNHETLRFAYGTGADGAGKAAEWFDAGPDLDATILSDDFGGLGFTGAFYALTANDLNGTFAPADFDSFTYRELT